MQLSEWHGNFSHEQLFTGEMFLYVLSELHILTTAKLSIFGEGIVNEEGFIL